MLKSGDVERIQQMIKRMQKEARLILRGIVEMAWIMKGAISYTELLHMTYPEKNIVSEFIDKNSEVIKNSMSRF